MRRLDEVDILTPDEIRLLTDLKQRILAVAPGASVTLYGSAARGERTSESDYDVLVLLRARISREEERRLHDLAYDLELERDVVLSLAIYTADMWEQPAMRGSPYRKSVLIEGIAV